MQPEHSDKQFVQLDLDIMVKVGCQHKRVSQVFWDVVHRARQFYLKVHRTSVTHDVMRGGRANTRPGGRGEGS